MLTKLQIYLLIGCILTVGGAIALYEFLPAFQVVRSSAPTSSLRSGTGAHEVKPNTGDSKRVPLPVNIPLPDRHFKLMAKSQNTITSGQAEQKLDAEIELRYIHHKTTNGIIVAFYSLGMKTFEAGRFEFSYLITRDRFVEQSGSQTNQRSFEEVSSEQQAKMKASFATNFCKILLDGNQNEIRREIISEAGAALINEGLLNTTRLMHGPFCQESNTWASVKRIPMEMGLVIDCPIQYTKAGTSPARVSVAGSFSKDEIRSSSPHLAIKQISCGLFGTEFFDEAEREYTSGELILRCSFQVFEDGVLSGTIQGTTMLSLEQVTTVN